MNSGLKAILIVLGGVAALSSLVPAAGYVAEHHSSRAAMQARCEAAGGTFISTRRDYVCARAIPLDQQ